MVIGWLVAPAFLHPFHRPLPPDLVKQADVSFAQIGALREPLDVRAPDGVRLHGGKVRPSRPNGSWVLLFHGVADNRMGVLEPALILLRAGYGVTMMGARAHGESDGSIGTYGWLEGNDTRAIIDVLVASEHPAHIYALGESMGWDRSAVRCGRSAYRGCGCGIVFCQPARSLLRLCRSPKISAAGENSLPARG